MDLKRFTIQAPTKVFGCHLRFPTAAGTRQYGDRAHLLERVKGGEKHAPAAIYRLDGETMFKAGEVIETDFVFPKSMKVQVEEVESSSAA